jgi:nucleotide-binding universal stress UspA family protein
MTTFRATWVIDVDTDDAAEAARKARDYQLRSDAQVGVFEVTDGQGRVVKADLDEKDEREQLAPQIPSWIESLRPIEEEAALLASVYLFGVLHHAWFVQVVDEDGDQVAVNDPSGRLAEFQQLDADRGRMQTIQIPGHPGDYVLVIYPAGD